MLLSMQLWWKTPSPSFPNITKCEMNTWLKKVNENAVRQFIFYCLTSSSCKGLLPRSVYQFDLKRYYIRRILQALWYRSQINITCLKRRYINLHSISSQPTCVHFSIKQRKQHKVELVLVLIESCIDLFVFKIQICLSLWVKSSNY